jgi:periplasmic divalent cation tolerance protein
VTPLLVFCTFPDAAVAERIVRVLVEERLAACGNIVSGVLSIYRWQGTVERAGEVSVVLKTAPARWEALRDRLRALHPYEVPEIVGVPASDADPDYARWVVESVTPGGG